jgi:hypothetical protein
MTISYWTGWEGYAITIPIILGLIIWYLKNEISKPKDADTLNEQFKRYKNK